MANKHYFGEFEEKENTLLIIYTGRVFQGA